VRGERQHAVVLQGTGFKVNVFRDRDGGKEISPRYYPDESVPAIVYTQVAFCRHAGHLLKGAWYSLPSRALDATAPIIIITIILTIAIIFWRLTV
jgi:hypothetical protein